MSKSMFSEGSKIDRPFRVLAVQEEPEVQFEDITEKMFLESSEGAGAMFEAVSALAAQTARQEAAAAVIQWVEGGDSDFNDLDAMLFGMVASGTEDEEDLDDVQYEQYEQLSNYAAEFIATLTGDDADIELMGDDEQSADRVFGALESALEDVDTDEALAEFAVRDAIMLESADLLLEAKKKVIRNGQVTYIKKRTRKRRMTAAQKAALKKARRKANTGAAKAARKKSMRQRESRGM